MDSDSELLQRFAATGDETAFATLVGRHAGMVQGVVWRRTQDWVLAEEITQNVFAILARKASALRHERLAGWLHHAAILEARNASRKAARYREALHHFSAHMMNTPSYTDTSWEELRPHLDEAMSCLPAEARHLVVMRYLERRSLEEIAAATGRTAEACRKRIQRSIHLLEALLQKRGLSSTGSALAVTLAAQNLCVPSASAAAIAAAALKSAPGLTLASLIPHTVHLMNTTTIVKTAAVVLVIAAIPITILWRQNAGLETTLRRVQTPPPPPPSPRPPTGTRTDDQSGAGPPGAAQSAASEPADGSAAAGTADSTMKTILKRVAEKSERRANMEFTRICLNLPDLTTSQKAQIKQALDGRSRAALDEMLKAFQSNAVARGIQNPDSLTAEEKAVLAKMDPRKTTAVAIDEDLKSILTAEQHDAHVKAKEAKRVSDAEDAATDTLKFIGRSFDLSAEQKDQIFQELARYELSPEQAAGVEDADAFPQISARDDARDQIIRPHLTPEQAEVFDQTRAAEREALKRQMMEFYAKPGAGQRGGTKR